MSVRNKLNNILTIIFITERLYHIMHFILCLLLFLNILLKYLISGCTGSYILHLCYGMWTLSCSTWGLVLWPGIEFGPPGIGSVEPQHWSITEVPHTLIYIVLFFSCKVISDSLCLHGLHHARLPGPSLSLGICSNSCLKSEKKKQIKVNLSQNNHSSPLIKIVIRAY